MVISTDYDGYLNQIYWLNTTEKLLVFTIKLVELTSFNC